MAKNTLEAKKRTEKGKSKRLVEEGLVPGVVYDQDTNSTMITIPSGELKTVISDAVSTTFIDLTVEGDKKPRTTIIKEIQRDPRTNKIIHISFMQLDEKKKITVPVNVELIGNSKAVKNNVGILVTVTKYLTITGYPKDIPEYLELDITPLEEIGDTVSVNSIEFPEGVKLVQESDKNLTAASIRPFQKLEIEEPEEEKTEGLEILEGEELPEGVEVPEGEEGELPEGVEAPEGEEGKTSTESSRE